VRIAGIVLVQGSNQSHSFSSLSSGDVPFGKRNLALVDLLGESVLNRVVSRLQKFGIAPITVISDTELDHAPKSNGDGKAALEYSSSNTLPTSLQQVLNEFSKRDAKAVVSIQLSAYAEVDYSDLLRFHCDHGKPATSVYDAEGPLQISVFNLKQLMQNAELLCDSWNGSSWDRNRSLGRRYSFDGYVNRLETPYDFRRLAQDALYKRCELRPAGREIRPGLWVGDWARIDSAARIVSPAYIGARSKVRAAALITRGSCLEHHCEVDCRTIIDDAHILPFTYLGPGLEVEHALVDGGRLLHLARNLELQIHDRKLLGRLGSPSLLLKLKDKVLERILSGASEDLPAPTPAPEAASLHTADEIAP
jgi:NDP-sugar pyrophosphorylase family protein